MINTLVTIIVVCLVGGLLLFGLYDLLEGIFDLGKIGHNVQKQKAVAEHGEPAKARVLSIQQTGTFVNENPMVHMTLEIQREGQKPYEATIETIVELVAIPRVQPGCELSVRVDVKNPSTIALVW